MTAVWPGQTLKKRTGSVTGGAADSASVRTRGERSPGGEPQVGVRLSTQNRTPLYHQIYLILRSKILDGEYKPGEYLPGERDIERLFNVSRITAVRSLNELAAAGLVVRERGRGTRVMFVGQGIVSRGPYGEQVEDDVRRGSPREVLTAMHKEGKASVVVYNFEYVTPTATVARALNLESNAVVQYAERVWRNSKVPFSYLRTWVPEDVGRYWTKRDLQSTPMGDLLEKTGIKIGLVQERVMATLADSLLSERLEIEVGSPILKIQRTAMDVNQRPVEHVVGFYPPERYQYEVTLPRSQRDVGPVFPVDGQAKAKAAATPAKPKRKKKAPSKT